MSEHSYGDDGPAYGDDGPAYGDDGPAYGDHGPAYADDAAYGDEGPYGGYEEEHYGDAAYAQDDYDAVAYDASEDPAGQAPAEKPAGSGRGKRIALMMAGFLGLGGVAAGAYMFLSPGGDDPLALVRTLPIVSELLPPASDAAASSPSAPAAARAPAAAGFSLAAYLPFLAKHEAPENVNRLLDNLTAVQRAVNAYAAKHHALPSTTAVILKEMKALKLTTDNPFAGDMAAAIDLGDAPKEPGAIGYMPRAGGYELRTADGQGQVLAINGTPVVLEGKLETAEANAWPGDLEARDDAPDEVPAAHAWAEPAASGAVAAKGATGAAIALTPATGAIAALPKAMDSAGGGMDGMGGLPLTDLLPGHEPASPPPLAPLTKAMAEDPSMIPSPTMSMTGPQIIAWRLKRNKAFDFYRNKGMSLVYSARTVEALDAFKKALEIRPNDPTCVQWVSTINGVIDKTNSDAKAKHDEEVAAAQKAIANARAQRAADGAAAAPPPRAYIPPPPVPKRDSADDAAKMLDELKRADKVPLLAPPKLDN